MKLVIFTDLDGTLLNHDDYSFEDAKPALDRLRALQIPVVLATSKTAAEVAPLQVALGLTAFPAIVENGAAVLEQSSGDNSAYKQILAALAQLPSELRGCFAGFADLGVDGVAQATGLPPPQAALACQRMASEPGLWNGTDQKWQAFLEQLSAFGISARRGGRFVTLSFGQTKADRMADICRSHRPDKTIALGDAPNDVEMIELADYGVIIRNDHGNALPSLAGEPQGRIRRTEKSGAAGWNVAVQDILNELKL